MTGFNSVRKFLSDCLSTLYEKPRPVKCNVTRQSVAWLQQADLISAPRRNARVTAGKTTIDCRQNIPRLLLNALLTTPYVK